MAESHEEWIKCPECQKAQKAEVEHTYPFWSYVHFCECGFIIGESEWEVIEVREHSMEEQN